MRETGIYRYGVEKHLGNRQPVKQRSKEKSNKTDLREVLTLLSSSRANEIRGY
jgi:hypothetical protein